MSDITVYKFEMRDGLPPDGELGQFFGFDANGAAYILRWATGRFRSGWMAVGFALPTDAIHYEAVVHAIKDENANRIVSWSPAPALWSEVLPSDATP